MPRGGACTLMHTHTHTHTCRVHARTNLPSACANTHTRSHTLALCSHTRLLTHTHTYRYTRTRAHSLRTCVRTRTLVCNFFVTPPVILTILVLCMRVLFGGVRAQVGMNNQVWYHRADASGRGMVSEREYVSTVDSVKLTSTYAAVLSDGKITIHPIDPAASGERSMMVRLTHTRTLTHTHACNHMHTSTCTHSHVRILFVGPNRCCALLLSHTLTPHSRTFWMCVDACACVSLCDFCVN